MRFYSYRAWSIVFPHNLANVSGWRLRRPDALSSTLGSLLGLVQGCIIAVVANFGQTFSDQFDGNILSLFRVSGANEHVAVLATGRDLIADRRDDRLADEKLAKELARFPGPRFVVRSGGFLIGSTGQPGSVDFGQGKSSLWWWSIPGLTTDDNRSTVKNLRISKAMTNIKILTNESLRLQLTKLVIVIHSNVNKSELQMLFVIRLKSPKMYNKRSRTLLTFNK